MESRRALPVWVFAIVAFVAALGTLAVAGAAYAAFPGQNGKLVFIDVEPPCQPGNVCDEVDLYTANPDGSGRAKLLAATGLEQAAHWSPDGQELVYAAVRGGNRDIYRLAADGSAPETRLTTAAADDSAPAWTPDGGRVVFASNRSGTYDLWAMNADGTGITQLTSGPALDHSPAVSPDGSRIAFVSDRDASPSSCRQACTVYTIYLMDIDGSAVTRVPIDDGPECWTSTSELHPDWSPAGDRLAFSWLTYADCGFELDFPPGRIQTIRPDGTGQRTLVEDFADLSEPAWSPDGTRIVYSYFEGLELRSVDSDTGFGLDIVTTGDMPDWQPLPVNTPSSHVRPIAASPITVSLVPAWRECTGAGNRTHGPPLAFPSCAPPQQASPNLTVRVPNGDNLFKSFARLAVRLGPPGGVDDTDVRLRASLSHVMRASDFSEYTGELRAAVKMRVTDKEGAVSSTIQDFPLEFDIPCVPTDDPNLKSVCDVATGLDAVIPGASPERTRAVWALDQVRVYDGGPDEDADTEGDNSLFATQGIFVP